jgi:hypothetical protein
MADTIVEYIFKEKPFTWQGGRLSQKTDEKTAYIKALRKADSHDINDLISFARPRSI